MWILKSLKSDFKDMNIHHLSQGISITGRHWYGKKTRELLKFSLVIHLGKFLSWKLQHYLAFVYYLLDIGYKQIIRKTFLLYQFQKLTPNSKQFAVLMTTIRLPRKKAALLARVGRNALHPDVIMVVPASELIGKTTIAATFFWAFIFFVTCVSSFNPLNNLEVAQVVQYQGKYSDQTLWVQISVLPLCDWSNYLNSVCVWNTQHSK